MKQYAQTTPTQEVREDKIKFKCKKRDIGDTQKTFMVTRLSYCHTQYRRVATVGRGSYREVRRYAHLVARQARTFADSAKSKRESARLHAQSNPSHNYLSTMNNPSALYIYQKAV